MAFAWPQCRIYWLLKHQWMAAPITTMLEAVAIESSNNAEQPISGHKNRPKNNNITSFNAFLRSIWRLNLCILATLCCSIAIMLKTIQVCSHNSLFDFYTQPRTDTIFERGMWNTYVRICYNFKQ